MSKENKKENKRVDDKEKIQFLLEKLYGFVDEILDQNSLYVPNKEFFFNDNNELIKIIDHNTGEKFTA